MNQWLTKTELLGQYNISRDVLADMVWNGELKAYKRGDPSSTPFATAMQHTYTKAHTISI